MPNNNDYTQVPIGQATTIWQAFDAYINDLVEANPETFDEEDWYQQWYSIHHILTDWSLNPEIGIALITNKPQSTLVDAVQQLLKDIPFLAADCSILYDESDKDVISFCIHPYEAVQASEAMKSQKDEASINKLKDDDSSDDRSNDEYSDNTKDNNNNSNNERSTEEEKSEVKNNTLDDSLLSYEITEGDNDNDIAKAIDRAFEGCNVKEIMQLPNTLRNEVKTIKKVAEEVEARLETIKLAVIKSTKTTINEYKEEVMKNANEEFQRKMELKESEMRKAMDQHFETKLATTKRLLLDFDGKLQQKINEAKAKVNTFNFACDQKKNEIESKRKEIESMKVPVTPKRFIVKNPYKTPPSKKWDATTRIRGGGESSPSRPLPNDAEQATSSTITKVNEKYVEFYQPQGMYTLRDNDFKRNSPPLQICKKTSDIVHIYNALESSANSYNIMVTPFNDVQVWDKDPMSVPTTCNMQFDVENDDNLQMVYSRMSSAIYEKLRKANFLYIPKFNKILNSTRTTDGFVILYKLIESQHPHLTSEQKRPPKPTLNNSTCIYDFLTEYENWLDYESISSRTYTPAEKIEYLMDQLQQEEKYEEAYKLVSSQYMIYKQDKLRNYNAPFPHSLLLTNVDSTIATVYGDDEQYILYGDISNSDSDSNDNAQVHAMHANPTRRTNNNQRNNRSDYNNNQHFYGRLFQSPERKNWKRKPIQQWCKCCGTFGHDVFRNGCDFAAKVLLAESFLARNPNMQQRIIDTYKAAQKKNGENRKTHGIMARRLQENAARRNIQVTGNVRALFDIVGETLENEGLGYESDNADNNAEVKVLDKLDNMQLESDNSQDEYHDTQE